MVNRDLNGWYKLRWQVLRRDNFTCQYCGQKAPDVPLEVDHKVELCDGGTNSLNNLITSCWSCNRGKNGLHQAIVLAAKSREYWSKRKAQLLIKEIPEDKDTISKAMIVLLSEHKDGLSTKQMSTALSKTVGVIRMTANRLKGKGKITKDDKLWKLT